MTAEVVEEPISEFGPEKADEDEIPDWLKVIEGVDESSEGEMTVTVGETDDELPDWLQEITTDDVSLLQDELEKSPELEPESAEEVEIPAWLQETQGEDESVEEAELQAEGEAEEGDLDSVAPVAAGVIGAGVVAEILDDDEGEEIKLEEEKAEEQQDLDFEAENIEEVETSDWIQEVVEESQDAIAELVTDIDLGQDEDAKIPDLLPEIEEDLKFVEDSESVTLEESDDEGIPDWTETMVAGVTSAEVASEILDDASGDALVEAESSPDEEPKEEEFIWLEDVSPGEVEPKTELDSEQVEEIETPEMGEGLSSRPHHRDRSRTPQP